MKLRILAQLASEVWAMHRPAFETMVAQLEKMNLPEGITLFGPPSAEQLAAIEERSAVRMIESSAAADIPDVATRRGPKSGTVAVVQVRGPILHRDSFFSFLFGGTSVERLTATINELAANEAVSTILLDIDSPGGTSAGLTECAAAIRDAAAVKNVVAVSNIAMCSAAYWLGSQADEIVAPDVSMTGSVGCYLYHEDYSGMYAQLGINPTYIYTPEFKVEGNEEFPLTDEAKADMQHTVDAVYELFVADVAAGRKITAAKVRDNYGKGRALLGKDAKAAGIIDRVATFNETLSRLVGTRGMADVASRAEGSPVEAHDAILVREQGQETIAPTSEQPAPEPPSDPAPDDDGQEPENPPDAPLDVAMRSRRFRVATL